MGERTPGPWRAERGVIVADIPNDGFQTTAVAYYGDEWRHSGGLPYADPRDANGHLIAAAPDLLAACKEFVRKVDAGEARSTRSYEQMKSAIAKAEGRT